MSEAEFQMAQLVNLAIGSPEVGAVNFNLLQKVLMEMLRLTDLDRATVKLSVEDAAKIEDIYSIKPLEKDGSETDNQDDQLIKKTGQCPIDPEKFDQMLENVAQLKFDVEDITTKIANISATPETTPFQEMRASLSQISGLQDKLQQIETLVEKVDKLDLGDSNDMSLSQRLQHLEKFVDSHTDQLGMLNSLVEEKVKHIDQQMESLEKEIGEIQEIVNVQQTSSQMRSLTAVKKSSVQDPALSINNVISRLSSVQHDLDNLTLTTINLTEEQERRQMLMDVLTEQVEVLKLTKAEKTNMEDILAAKADMSQVHRKVSHDHFENKIDQMTALMDDAFFRLDAHEDMWQEEVEELKIDIENKLDKNEFLPLKEYVNEKIKTIQEKMKALANIRKETTAAGAKKKIIRDVQCISCDGQSIMKADNLLDDVNPMPPLPTQQSVKPYLTYKLDQVRKQQKKLPTGRNLNQFEEMLRSTDPKAHKPMQAAPRSSGEQVVNRYVGGSHTITTPQQRLTRTGNFYDTWGPVITAVNPAQASAA